MFNENQKVVLFNGPPGSGKSTAAGVVGGWLGLSVLHFSFSDYVKHIVLQVYGITEMEWEEWVRCPVNKELPRERLNWLSPRQALIHMSEEIIKPNFGKDWVANKTMEDLRSIGAKWFVCDDIGFQEEIDACTSHFPKENVYLIHLESEGCSFDNDSRNYVLSENVSYCNFFKINNTKDNYFWEELDSIVRGW